MSKKPVFDDEYYIVKTIISFQKYGVLKENLINELQEEGCGLPEISTLEEVSLWLIEGSDDNAWGKKIIDECVSHISREFGLNIGVFYNSRHNNRLYLRLVSHLMTGEIKPRELNADVFSVLTDAENKNVNLFSENTSYNSEANIVPNDARITSEDAVIEGIPRLFVEVYGDTRKADWDSLWKKIRQYKEYLPDYTARNKEKKTFDRDLDFYALYKQVESRISTGELKNKFHTPTRNLPVKNITDIVMHQDEFYFISDAYGVSSDAPEWLLSNIVHEMDELIGHLTLDWFDYAFNYKK